MFTDISPYYVHWHISTRKFCRKLQRASLFLLVWKSAASREEPPRTLYRLYFWPASWFKTRYLKLFVNKSSSFSCDFKVCISEIVIVFWMFTSCLREEEEYIITYCTHCHEFHLSIWYLFMIIFLAWYPSSFSLILRLVCSLFCIMLLVECHWNMLKWLCMFVRRHVVI